jgi:hypothetical protein
MQNMLEDRSNRYPEGRRADKLTAKVVEASRYKYKHIGDRKTNQWAVIWPAVTDSGKQTGRQISS